MCSCPGTVISNRDKMASEGQKGVGPVSGVGGMRVTAGIDEEATGGKGGGRVNGGGGGD